MSNQELTNEIIKEEKEISMKIYFYKNWFVNCSVISFGKNEKKEKIKIQVISINMVSSSIYWNSKIYMN